MGDDTNSKAIPPDESSSRIEPHQDSKQSSILSTQTDLPYPSPPREAENKSHAEGGFSQPGMIVHGDVRQRVVNRHTQDGLPSITDAIRTAQFRPLIEDKTRAFVGREFIFRAIEEKLKEADRFPSGYIIIEGEPGIGKTALMAQLCKQSDYIHHFNIRQSIHSTTAFLESVCAQLIARYQLKHSSLPKNTAQDGGVLVELLTEAVQKARPTPVVILVDALDEAEDTTLPGGANPLYLPPSIPAGAFFIVTQRRRRQGPVLVVNHPHYLYIEDRDPQNMEDVRRYILKFLSESQEEMRSRIHAWQVNEEEFVSIMMEKSDGNFMYLVLVLEDIRSGQLTAETIGNIHNLPTGLRSYYLHHWERMKVENQALFERCEAPVICQLAAAQEPVSVSLLREWLTLSAHDIQKVLDKWHEFLNGSTSAQGVPVYRLYHASFQDFLREDVGLKVAHTNVVSSIRSIIRRAMGGTDG